MNTIQNHQTAGEDAPRYMKAKPLARRVGVCSKTIFRWHEAGHISARKLTARTVLFDVREVEAFVEGSRVMRAAA